MSSMIPMFKVAVAPDAHLAIKEVLESGMIGEGPAVEKFTEKLRDLFEHKNVLALNSCTSALALALRLVKRFKPGDFVLSTPFTMIATNTSIAEAGGRIVWADIDPTTLAIDVDKVQNLSGIRAIMCTLVGGVAPHGLDRLFQFCDEQRIALILDCAHAIDATYKGKHISHWGHFSCFSFQAIKHVAAGDGGALVCRSDDDHARAEKLKWFGMTRKVPEGMTRLQHQMNSDVQEAGFKVHMNDVAAAIGLANFQLGLENAKKSRANANELQKRLAGINGVQLLNPPADSSPSWWVYGFLTKKRDALMRALEEAGIVSTPMWRPNNRYTCFNGALQVAKDLPGLDRIAEEVLFVPNGFWVDEQTIAKIAEIVKCVHEGVE